MIRKDLIKGFALGMCMSALTMVNTNKVAFAETGAGSLPAYAGIEYAEDQELIDKQNEMDQYLFVEHVKDFEDMNFNVVYTGVADKYVEVGITPYSDENAKYIYNIFGKDIVKVVEADVTVVLDETRDVHDVTLDYGGYDTMDFGGNAYDSEMVADGDLAKERELMANSGEEYSIQIESIDIKEPEGNISEDERIRQSAISEDIVSDEDEAMDIALTSAEDGEIMTAFTDKQENQKKDISVFAIVAVAFGGIIIACGSYFAAIKKKTIKSGK